MAKKSKKGQLCTCLIRVILHNQRSLDIALLVAWQVLQGLHGALKGPQRKGGAARQPPQKRETDAGFAKHSDPGHPEPQDEEPFISSWDSGCIHTFRPA